MGISAIALECLATKCRLNVIRMLKSSGHGHLGGALSAIDIVTALYFSEMNIDPNTPDKSDRDRFVLSTGHKCLAQYAVLAEKGFFDKEILDTYGQLNSAIPGHPNMQKLPGIEANTGALGHGLAIANGMAASAKLRKDKSRVFVMMGDGELPEGSNWEAAAQAAKFKLDNLILFVDYNGLQISGSVEDVLNMQPVMVKFESFGWAVHEIDGNDMRQILEVLKKLPFEEGKPSIVFAKTIKAKGIPTQEGKTSSHFWKPSGKELEQCEMILKAKLSYQEKIYEAVS